MKKKYLLNFLIITLGGLLILGSFFLGKFLANNSTKNNSDITDNIIDNNKIKEGEIDLTNNKTLINDIETNISIPNFIIKSFRNGKNNDFSDFLKTYISLYNITLNDSSKFLCNDSKVDMCINENIVDEKKKVLFGINTEINNSNYKEFKKYPFYELSNSSINYDKDKKMYIIKNVSNGAKQNNGYVKTPFRLTKDDKTYYLSYYVVYVDKGNTSDDKYTFYTNEDKKEKIFVLNKNDQKEYENRILKSSIKRKFKRLILTLKEEKNKLYIVQYKMEN